MQDPASLIPANGKAASISFGRTHSRLVEAPLKTAHPTHNPAQYSADIVRRPHPCQSGTREKVKYTEAKASVGLRVNKFANSEGTRLGHRQQQIGVEDAAARSSVTLEIDGLTLPEEADR